MSSAPASTDRRDFLRSAARGAAVMTMALGGGNSISIVPSESPWVGSK